MSKESQIVEVLEDGTIYAFDMDVCDREAEKALKSLRKKEGKLFNFDYSATVFTLFVYCIHLLRESGWQTQELLNEVLDHTQEYDDAEFGDEGE
jgi:hypothetical protein